MSPAHIQLPLPCTDFTRELLSRVGDKWSILIVVHLERGPLRFNELKRSIDGISQRMLTLTLKGLEKDGLVLRTVFPTIPPSVTYELTELGRTLMAPMMALVMWSKNYQAEVELARTRYQEKQASAGDADSDGPRAVAPGVIRRLR